ncbi:unnamed protein product [Macrosiphum euphorbiae]|uniref:Uncharacterized protein n=1 Tax=Macrosiphum euphorbiae TaxID=13131 RepID=A0AAV0VHG2_9HEMI|nr:unnamed protein product [Macrosiphum euphorbiae]
MRSVLILCVIIAAAVACPLSKECSCNLPKICPSNWKIKTFDSQYATLAFQRTWYLQLATPTYIDQQNPLKTGLFCNSYPCTKNQLIFTDTTPCDDTDYNTEYEVIDSSYNIYTQCTETQKALLCPAYGSCSPYAIFNVGSEKYYTNPIIEKYPFIDQDLFRHKIGQGSCEREYTVAVIGGDDCYKEYMVLVVINQYDNFFGGNNYIIWVLTRDVNPDWCTYDKAYNDIKESGLSPNYLVSVDHSLESLGGPSMTVPSMGPSMTVPSMAPTMPGDIDGMIQKTSVSTTSATKSISTDCGTVTSSSTSTTTTSTTSTVIIDKSPDFSSLYDLGPCDLYNPYDGLQIYKNMDKPTIRRALSGNYYMTQATPCSFYDNPNSRVGLLNTCFPGCGMQLCFDDASIDDWDCNTPRMVMDRGYNMRTGEVQMTRSYISSVYSDDYPFGTTTYAFHSEGYYDSPIDETDCLPLDGMICKAPSDIYKNQIIASIIGYKDDDYLMFCIANRYKNPLFPKKQVPLVYCYTRERIPSQATMNSITQEMLRCGLNPNYLMKIDQSKPIDDVFTFDKAYYESTVTSTSMTKSMVSTRGLAIRNTPLQGLPSICPQEWDVKTFDSQYATIAFQGTWNVQMTSPTYINGNNPLKTGLFCNSYPCAGNQLLFKDTTPCDDTDFNIEYEMIDSSYNLYTQCTETQKALLSPAYGSCSPYAIFNVGSEKYYKTAITEKYPFIDKDLIRHKIGQGTCEREYTVAVIGGDDCYNEYMVLVVINQYDNFFGGNKYLIWVVTREANPKWSTYKKAYEDIERSGLSPNYLVSVDHSIDSMSAPTMTVPSMGPSITVPSMAPTMPGDIDGIIQKTSVSTTSATKSISTDCGSTVTSSSTSTTTTSTVIIDKSPDFSGQYEFGQCDLYNGIQIYKNLDKPTIKRALSGKYYMSQATPCSYYNSPNSRVGLLNTCFPGCGMQLCFDDASIDDWDCNTPRMVMDRGYNMRTGEVQMTRSYISSVYSDDYPFGTTTYAFHSEGYYDSPIEETDCLPLDGMICKAPSDIYKNQIIASIIGYKDDDYLIFCIANRYKNPLFSSTPVNQVIAYTRQRIPSPETIRSMTQELLQCGYNPNHLIKVDQTMYMDDDYVFESSYYESQTSCWSSSSSSCSSSTSSSSYSSSSSSSSISISCD